MRDQSPDLKASSLYFTSSHRIVKKKRKKKKPACTRILDVFTGILNWFNNLQNSRNCCLTGIVWQRISTHTFYLAPWLHPWENGGINLMIVYKVEWSPWSLQDVWDFTTRDQTWLSHINIVIQLICIWFILYLLLTSNSGHFNAAWYRLMGLSLARVISVATQTSWIRNFLLSVKSFS